MQEKQKLAHTIPTLTTRFSIIFFVRLIPLRIGHYPGVVLEVVVTDVNQGDTSSAAVLGNNNVVSELSVALSSRGEVASVTRDVASLRISEIGDDNQALIVRPHGHLSEGAIQSLPNQSASHHPPGADNMTLQEQLHQLQQQVQQIHREIQEIQGRIQQTGQQAEDTQQRMKDDVATTLQQMDQRIQDSVQQLREQVEETCQTTQQSALQIQQHEDALRIVQQQLQQQIEKWDQETQGSHQQTQDDQQQLQQQLSEAMGKIQHMDQLVQHSQRQHQQLQRQILKMEKVCQQDHSSQGAFDQFLHAQHLVRSVLVKPPEENLFSRLFIILPEPSPSVDVRERSCPFQFRLYFLCECRTHSVPRDCNKPHEVHLTNHPGYDLVNHNNFLKKFGSYLLTMMHMVKYGVTVGGLVVPPLLGLRHAIEDGESQRHLPFIKKNFSRLVDDMITHLQEAVGGINCDISTHQSLDSTDLTS